MQGVKNGTIACVCAVIWVYLVRTSVCEPIPMGTENAPRTARNKPAFGSPDELRSYLDELGQYFAVVGRPRFGKRNLLPCSSGPLMKEPAIQRVRAEAGFLPVDNGEMYQLFYRPENEVS